MTQDEMYKRIQQFDKEIQKRKTKRNIKLFLGITIVFFLICIYWFKKSILDSLILALVFSGIYFFSGLIIWGPFARTNYNENRQLEEMKMQYAKEFNSTWC